MIFSALRFIPQSALAMIAIISMVLMSAMVRAEGSLGWVGDLPVPAEALIDTQSAVNFDSPSGRVIQFTFQVALSAGEVQAFYQTALAELGWNTTGDGFVRGNERITIVKAPTQNAGARTIYYVAVSPVN